MGVSMARAKAAVVTGSTSGIGLGIAHGLVECGATVVISGRDEARIESAVAKLNAQREGSASGVRCDVADAAMGCALASTLEDDETFTSLDLTVKFFKPIWNARIKAAARLVRRTRTLAFLGDILRA